MADSGFDLFQAPLAWTGAAKRQQYRTWRTKTAGVARSASAAICGAPAWSRHRQLPCHLRGAPQLDLAAHTRQPIPVYVPAAHRATGRDGVVLFPVTIYHPYYPPSTYVDVQ